MSIWSKLDRGLYRSPLGTIIREYDGWHVFRPTWSEGPFTSCDAAKRWAEQNALSREQKRA